MAGCRIGDTLTDAETGAREVASEQATQGKRELWLHFHPSRSPGLPWALQPQHQELVPLPFQPGERRTPSPRRQVLGRGQWPSVSPTVTEWLKQPVLLGLSFPHREGHWALGPGRPGHLASCRTPGLWGAGNSRELGWRLRVRDAACGIYRYTHTHTFTKGCNTVTYSHTHRDGQALHN